MGCCEVLADVCEADPAGTGISEGGPAQGRWTRRDWLGAAVALCAIGAGGVLGGYASVQLLSSPDGPQREIRASFRYGKSPDTWHAALEGEPMRVTDFGLWQGAPGLWLQEFENGAPVAFTGFPVLVIRVPRDDANFRAPSDVPLPSGVYLYVDDPVRDIRIVGFYNRCTHLCCRTSWHRYPVPAGLLGDIDPGPTWDVYGLDPIWCLCHDAMFDPMVLEWGGHPTANPRRPTGYVGARVVHGPAKTPLPVVPLHVENDVLIGVMADPDWYEAYCQ